VVDAAQGGLVEVAQGGLGARPLKVKGEEDAQQVRALAGVRGDLMGEEGGWMG
jgi:hypothetical protein